jgi:4-amino-4-deoxy-L-arabinose transferase-like glycosyltransferase
LLNGNTSPSGVTGFSVNNQNSTINSISLREFEFCNLCKSTTEGVEVIQRSRTDWLLLAGFCGFLFFFGLNYIGLIGADEPRYAQVAREMLARHDWITPTLGGEAWLEKPPLYYWQAMMSYRVFGASDWAARIPSALDATIMVVAIYLFLRRFRPAFQLDGALIAASCAAVIGYGRAASTDMPLAATFTMALLAWYGWCESGRKIYLAAFYFMLALATLAKGPVAPVLAALIIVIFAASQRDFRILRRSLWLPGIALFLVVALPWYVLVQVRNPDFFRVFIVEHNFARFGTNLYHHPEPFWYFLPVTLLGLLPWTVFVVAAMVETVRAWWSGGKSLSDSSDALNGFLLISILAPVVFFSISQSKLPGYILPGIPALALLLAEYIRRHVADEDEPARWLYIVHSVAAPSPLVPALMLHYIVLRHQVSWGTGLVVASAVALVVAVGMAVTLTRVLGLRLLRFVTLVPVVLAVGAVLRIGGPALDATLSARPVAKEISGMETKPLPMAVFEVSRETDYGLAFYRNQVMAHYEWGQVPPGEHLLVARGGMRPEVERIAAGRRVSALGNFPAQHLDYYWVSAPGMGMQTGHTTMEH